MRKKKEKVEELLQINMTTSNNKMRHMIMIKLYYQGRILNIHYFIQGKCMKFSKEDF